MNGLQIVEDAGLLSGDEVSSLQELRAELERTFETAQVFRTRTEMELSVLNEIKRPTPDAQYWQATREQDVMLIELVLLSFEYHKNELETRKLRVQAGEESDSVERDLLLLEIARRGFVAHQMERTAHHRLREIQEWSAIKKELEPHLEFGTEDVNAHQLKAMTLRYQAEVGIISQHTPVADAFNVLSLNVASKRRSQEAC